MSFMIMANRVIDSQTPAQASVIPKSLFGITEACAGVWESISTIRHDHETHKSFLLFMVVASVCRKSRLHHLLPVSLA